MDPLSELRRRTKDATLLVVLEAAERVVVQRPNRTARPPQPLELLAVLTTFLVSPEAEVPLDRKFKAVYLVSELIEHVSPAAIQHAASRVVAALSSFLQETPVHVPSRSPPYVAAAHAVDALVALGRALPPIAYVKDGDEAPGKHILLALLRYSLDARPRVRRNARTGVALLLESLSGDAASSAGKPVQGTASDDASFSDAHSRLDLLIPLPAAVVIYVHQWLDDVVDDRLRANFKPLLFVCHLLGDILHFFPTKVVAKLVESLVHVANLITRSHAPLLASLRCLGSFLETEQRPMGQSRSDARLFPQMLARLVEGSAFSRPGVVPLERSRITCIGLCLARLAAVDSAAALGQVETTLDALKPFVESSTFSKTALVAMRRVITHLVGARAVQQGVTHMETDPAAVPPLLRVFVSLTSLLTSPHLLHARGAVLQLLALSFRSIAPHTSDPKFRVVLASALQPCLTVLDSLRTATDADVIQGEVAGAAKQARDVDGALGAAIEALGCEAVLRILPLTLPANSARLRWMCRLLKRHVARSRLETFWSLLRPLADELAAKPALIPGVSAEDGARIVWSTFSAFCREPADAVEALPTIAAELLHRLQGDDISRHAILLGLRTLVACSLRVKQAATAAESNADSDSDAEDDDEEEHDYYLDVIVAPDEARIALADTTTRAFHAALLTPLLKLLPDLLRSGVDADRVLIRRLLSLLCSVDSATCFRHLNSGLRSALKQTVEQGHVINPDLPHVLLFALAVTPVTDDRKWLEKLYRVGRIQLKRPPPVTSHSSDEAAAFARVQRLGYQLVAGVAKAAPGVLSSQADEALAFLVQCGEITSESARRARLLCLSAVVRSMAGGAHGGFLSFDRITALSVPARQLLLRCATESMFAFKDSNPKVHAAGDALLDAMFSCVETEAGIRAIVRVSLASLVDADPLIRSASVVVLTRVLRQWRHDATLPEPLVIEIAHTVFKLFADRQREIATALFFFARELVKHLDADSSDPSSHLYQFARQVVAGAAAWIRMKSNPLRRPIQVVLARFAAVLGVEEVTGMLPNDLQRYRSNLRKRLNKEARAARRKNRGGRDPDRDVAMTGLAGDASDSDDSSDSDDGDGSDVEAQLLQQHSRASAGRLLEDDAGLLGEGGSTAALRLQSKKQAQHVLEKPSEPLFSEDSKGRLVIDENASFSRKKRLAEREEIAAAELRETFDDDDSELDYDGDSDQEVTIAARSAAHERAAALREQHRRRYGRGKRERINPLSVVLGKEQFQGRGEGDVLRSDMMEPFAFTRVNSTVLDRRQNGKATNQFKDVMRKTKAGKSIKRRRRGPYTKRA